MWKTTLIFKKIGTRNSALSTRFIVKNIEDESTEANDHGQTVEVHLLLKVPMK